MKAITIQQPYASLIADGLKSVENRSWPTTYRGPLAIHAGQGTRYLTGLELEKYPTGKVIAVCQLVACIHVGDLRKAADLGGPFVIEQVGVPHVIGANYVQQLASHEHTEGPFCWILDDVRKLETPVLYSGRQGLWEFDESLLEGMN